MKKIWIYLALSGSFLLALNSCQKLTEDPKATLTPKNYFKTQSDLDAAVAAIYVQLTPDFAWGFTSQMTSYFGSDDLTTDPGLNKGDMRAFDQLNGASSNASLLNEWKGPWNAIYQANNVLDNYQKVNSPDSLKQLSAGQAYFLRALSYYYLVRTFGEVPVITGAIDVSTRPQRDPVEKVYGLIVSDLQQAISWLPYTFKDNPGKATQNAARSLLSDVYLTMAGWPLNQPQYYAKAASEADTVIRSKQYSLVAKYADVFTNNNTVESIFALQFNVSGGVPQRRYGASSVPLDEVASDGSGGWDDYYPEINFYKNRPICERSDATFYDTLKLKQSNGSFKKVAWDSPLTHARHPYYKKFRAGLNGDGVKETADAILSINPSTNKALDLIRYPMVLLNYAEASAMAGSAPTSDGYTAINQVRQRAGEKPLTPGLGQTAFRDSVVRERAYEFAGEIGIRWFDIVRLQLLPQVLAERSDKENPINTGVLGNASLLKTRYLAPIPISDMNNDPAWDQNSGY